MRLLCLFLYVCLANAAFAEEPHLPNAVLLSKTKVSGNRTGAATHGSTEFNAGTVVKLLKLGGVFSYIEADGHIGWAPRTAIAPIARFMRIKAWTMQKALETGGGDYEARYQFEADGSFRVEETVQQGDQSYRLVSEVGHLYRYKNIVWAKVPGEPVYTSRMFIISKRGLESSIE